MKKPKKILFTVHDFYPKVGGAGEVILRLAKRFARAGFDVTVATEGISERDFNEIDGVKIRGFKIKGNKVKGYQGNQAEIRRYLDFAIKGNFDVIINYAAQSWCSDLCFENIEKIHAKKILVPCGYSALALCDPRYFFYFQWLPSVLERYDHLVYLSKITPDFLFHQKHQIKTPWILIPNGADEEEFLESCAFFLPKAHLKQKYHIQTKYLAICVSNYFFLKGQDFVIRAFNELDRDDVTLVLIGQQKNDFYFRLLKFLSRNNARILFFQNISRERTVNFFKAADLFLFGSRLECSPLVMFESFASKTLFITRPVGDIKGYTDYNVVVNSPAEMKEAIEKIILNKNFYQEKVGRAFQKYLNDHTYEEIFGRYLELVE